MKKALLFPVFLVILFCSAKAFALDSYTYSAYSDPVSLSKRIHPLSVVKLAFDQTLLSTQNFTSVGISFTGNVKARFLKDVEFCITVGNTLKFLYLGKLVFNNGVSNLISLDTAVLNNYIHSLSAGAPITLTLAFLNGGGNLTGATLSGNVRSLNVAPEPLSMALVGAGLIGLPFARRFRKSLT